MGRPRFTEEQRKAARKETCRKYYLKSHRRPSLCVDVPEGFYTYLWLREDGTPYYVGKGIRNRCFVNSSHGVHCPIDKHRILVQSHTSETEALEAEMFLIAYYGRLDTQTGCLRNLTEGGDFPPVKAQGKYKVSKEAKALIAMKVKRLWEDATYRSRTLASRRGKRK